MTDYLELAHQFSKERGGKGLSQGDLIKAQEQLKKENKKKK